MSLISLNTVFLFLYTHIGHGPVVLDFSAGIVRTDGGAMWSADGLEGTSIAIHVYASSKTRLCEMQKAIFCEKINKLSHLFS